MQRKRKQERVFIYDTTLRDGSQGEGASFSLEDKLKIALALDEFGVDWIEGGWPGSNPKDEEFFRQIQREKLKNAKIAAFGSTRRADRKVENDPQVLKLLDAQTPTVTIYGKTWTEHVSKVIKTTLQENLKMIYDTVKFLKDNGREVIFDAEHFFDGFRTARDYALACIESALEGGADWIVLCDTNGGSLPWLVEEAIHTIRRKFGNIKLGIHTHNDMELAVSNSVSAVKAGARQVQGTINGIGERCGNANLVSIIPILKLKMGFDVGCKLEKLKEISDFVWQVMNVTPPKNQPFVGASAFAHKGGVHIDAVMKDVSSYEHTDPSLVGNRRRILISDLAGKSAILWKFKEFGIEAGVEEAKKVLEKVKELEKYGYDFELADASLYLLMLKELGIKPDFFKIESYTVNVTGFDSKTLCEATVKVRVGDSVEITADEGNGPVNALDKALRKALEKFFPEIRQIVLKDFKVRVVSGSQGTGARVRVYVETGDGNEIWGTVGVSENVIEASLQALCDSIEYKLIRTRWIRTLK